MTMMMMMMMMIKLERGMIGQLRAEMNYWMLNSGVLDRERSSTGVFIFLRRLRFLGVICSSGFDLDRVDPSRLPYA